MNASQFRRRKNAFATAGALVTVTVAAIFAWRWTSGMDGAGVATELAMDTETPAPTFRPEEAPTLVDVLDAPERTKRNRPATRATRSPSDQAAGARSKSKKKKRTKERSPSSKASEGDGQPGSIKLQCSVTPSIDTNLVPDLNYDLPITLSFAPQDGGAGLGASTTKWISDRPTLTFALTGSSKALPRLVVDHPDALRSAVAIKEWSHQGNELWAAPLVKLRPIGLKVQLGTTTASKAQTHPFQGTATLVALDSNGNIQVLDSTGVGPQLTETKPLRYGKSSGEIYIIGTPSSAVAGAGLIEITGEVGGRPMDGAQLLLPTGLRGRTPAPIKFEVIDPFGEPLKDATVTARINERYVGRRTRSGLPVQFGGFVFVRSPGRGSGESIRNGQVRYLSLGLARAVVEDATSANGEAILHGVDRRVSTFTVKSPFGDRAPVEFQVEETSAFQITCAPLGGVEIHCPIAWRKDDEGRDAWARAKVKLSGKSNMLPFSTHDAQARNPRRFLVPASRTIKVTCAASGHPKMSGELTGPGQRQIATFFPEASE